MAHIDPDIIPRSVARIISVGMCGRVGLCCGEDGGGVVDDVYVDVGVVIVVGTGVGYGVGGVGSEAAVSSGWGGVWGSVGCC